MKIMIVMVRFYRNMSFVSKTDTKWPEKNEIEIDTRSESVGDLKDYLYISIAYKTYIILTLVQLSPKK